MAKKLTKSRLKRWLKIEDNRKALNRIASDLEKQAKALSEEFADYVREHGGVDKLIVEHGFRLTLHSDAGTVKWKDEFIRIAGLEAAEVLIKAAETREKLLIEAVGAAAKKKR